MPNIMQPISTEVLSLKSVNKNEKKINEDVDYVFNINKLDPFKRLL